MVSRSITIDKSKLANAQQQMAQIAQSIQANKLNPTLGRSEGASAEELLRIGEGLLDFAEAFSTLASQCAAALATALKKVEEMDAQTAALFDTEG